MSRATWIFIWLLADTTYHISNNNTVAVCLQQTHWGKQLQFCSVVFFYAVFIFSMSVNHLSMAGSSLFWCHSPHVFLCLKSQEIGHSRSLFRSKELIFPDNFTRKQRISHLQEWLGLWCRDQARWIQVDFYMTLLGTRNGLVVQYNWRHSLTPWWYAGLVCLLNFSGQSEISYDLNLDVDQ